jgi:hypothetical protein
MAMPEGTKMMILAPLVRGRRGQARRVYGKIRKAGFVRVRIDGQVYDLDSAPELSARQLHDIDAVVDRVIIRDGVGPRIGESLRLAIRHGEGVATACYLDAGAADPQHPQGIWRDRLVQHAVRLSALQHQSGGTRTADVQFQQSLRCLPALRRLGMFGAVRSGIGGAGQIVERQRRRHRALERLDRGRGPQASEASNGRAGIAAAPVRTRR